MFKVPLSILGWSICEIIFTQKTASNPLLYTIPFQILMISLYFQALWKQKLWLQPYLLIFIMAINCTNLCSQISSEAQNNIAFFISGMGYQYMVEHSTQLNRRIMLLMTIVMFNLKQSFASTNWEIGIVMQLETFLLVLIIQGVFHLNDVKKIQEQINEKDNNKKAFDFRRRQQTENLIHQDYLGSSQIHTKPIYSLKNCQHNKKKESTLKEIKESKTLFNILLNSIPDGSTISVQSIFLGVLVIDGLNNIQYINKCLKNMFPSCENNDVVRLLLLASNCCKDLEEIKLVENLFERLNVKWQKKKNDEQIPEDEDQLNLDFVQSTSSTIGQECENIFKQLKLQLIQDQVQMEAQGNQKEKQPPNFEFFCQSTMLSIIKKKDIQSRDIINEDQSFNSTLPKNFKNTYLQIIFKPFIKDRRAHILMVIRDVSMFNQINVLRNINQNKSKMLYHVSHEFRTPLNCIILMAQAMQEKLDTKLNDKFTSPILTSATQLLNLCNDLLDIAQLKAGKFNLNLAEFDLEVLLKQVQNLMNIQMQLKGIELLIKCSDQPFIICSDQNRVRQVILNLVGNALKFTSNGSIIIIAEREDRNQILVSIIDTGVGIDLFHQKRLFTEFGKLETEASVNTSGVGLGLVISNILARKLSEDLENQCKSIQIVSQGRGFGSTFKFYIYDHVEQEKKGRMKSQKNITTKVPQTLQIPQKVLSQKPIQVELQSFRSIEEILSSRYQFSDCACQEILMVDDHPFNIQALKQSLSKFALKIDTAYNGSDALEKVKNYPKQSSCGCQNYRIILMDIEMPVMDGLEATREIRKLVSLPITIYACSGHQSREEEFKAIQAGMNGFFVKPIKKQLIIDLIDQIKGC